MDTWLHERRHLAEPEEPAHFVAYHGRRVTTRSVDLAVRRIAREAGLSTSAHVLRHTFCTSLVRGGHDLVLVAELAGHRRLDTTRRYSLPTAADKQAAIETLAVDY